MAQRMRVRGACVFRNDGNGILSSQYVNEGITPFFEASQLIPGTASNNPFEGRYNSCWLEEINEDNPQVVTAILEIRFNSDLNSYSLTWRSNTNALMFSGVGFLYDNLLVAGYWAGS